MKSRLLYALLLVVSLQGYSNILAVRDGIFADSSSSLFLSKGESVLLKSSFEGSWICYKPVLKEYDNLSTERPVLPIHYTISVLNNTASDSLSLQSLECGTYYFGIVSDIPGNILTSEPIHIVDDNIIQIIVRENDCYTGYLTELISLPFVIPPKNMIGFGHQTDLHIGTDCAELAIYGIRRMGYKVPYCGPRGITDYLDKSDELVSGTILHFGFQVSVLYKENGNGKLDADDLLIHAYKDKVAIEKVGQTELLHLPYTAYKWKDNLLR